MTRKCENCIHEKVCGVLFPNNCPFYCEEPKQGEWIEINVKPTPFGGYTRDLKCNRCNRVTYEYQPKFCPNCGADMRKEGDEK